MDPKKATKQYCRVDQEEQPLPKPIFGLDCHDKCPDGRFATVDMRTRKFICDKCPANTYSVG